VKITGGDILKASVSRRQFMQSDASAMERPETGGASGFRPVIQPKLLSNLLPRAQNCGGEDIGHAVAPVGPSRK